MKFVGIGPMFRSFLILVIAYSSIGSVYSQVAVDSNIVIYGWKLDNNYIMPVKTDIDTNLVNFQLHNIASRNYTWLTTTGSAGSPYLANSFFFRKKSDDLLFLNSYADYLNTYSNTTYINSRKPFTHLQYLQSYPKSDREELLKVFHSQNINEKLNFGFDATIITDRSQYKYLNTSSKAFKVFSSYSGDNYSMHASVDMNRYFSGENGGVYDTSYTGVGQQNSWQSPKEVGTYFTGTGPSKYEPHVTNKIRYIDGMLSQSLKLFTFGKSNDSLSNSSSIAQPILSHVIKVRRASKIYEHSSKASGANNLYYPNNYSNWKETYDSTAEYRVSNTIQFDFKTKLKKKVIAGIFANINHDYIKYSYYSLLDTLLIDSSLVGINPVPTIDQGEYYSSKIKYGKRGVSNYDSVYDINNSKNLSNIYVSGGIYGKFWTHFESRFSGTLYISGYKAGQTKLDGLLNTNVKILKRPYQLMMKGSLENLTPSYQLSNYYSNHYMWENEYKNINRVLLSSKLGAPSNRFELEGHYALLSNYIYLTDSMPVAYGSPISVSALTLQKEFVVWKFHTYNKLTYQVSENRSVIEIPSILYFNSTYFDHTWQFKMTGGRLRTMLGVDVYYNSGFYGYEYIPALSMFYQQGITKSVGNYPAVDIWLNIRLKRTRFFFKLENVNNTAKDRKEQNLYHAVNYPYKLRTLKFGLSWTFYD